MFVKSFFINQNKYTIQYRSLHLMLLFGSILGYGGTLVGLINASRAASLLLSLTYGLLCTFLLYYSLNGVRPYIAKIVYIIFMNFLYFPFSWITTSGSLSFMPYYSILILLSTFLLIEYQYEYIFPGLYMVFAVFLIYAEVRWPSLVNPTEPATPDPFSLGFHYAVVAILIGIFFTTIFQHYLDVKKSLARHYTQDELSGLYTRSHGMKMLKDAFDQVQRTDDDTTLIMLSITNLRAINKSYGSDAGDHIIIDFSKILLSNTRSKDICARYNGNLFMILLNQAGPRQIDGFIERLNNAFASTAAKYPEIPLKLLVGKAGFDYNDIGEVMAAAEEQLDQAKQDFHGGINA